MIELATGARIGNYTLANLLGRTSMGEVWRAREAKGGTFALKTIASHAGDEATLRERFVREIAIHQNLRHSCIVPIRDFFEYDKRLYLIMDFIPGGSLEGRLDRSPGKPLPLAEALRVAQQILHALDHAHQKSIIHRDVKPSNILLHDDRAYLTDFGISLAVGGTRLTSLKQIVGTRFYMSPEQILHPQTINHLTDVFSFGCVLYEMLTGRQPFAGDDDPQDPSEYAVQQRQINAVAHPLRPLNSEISQRLERIVLTSLAKKPEDRFPGCASFANALEWAAQETRAVAVPSGAPAITVSPAVPLAMKQNGGVSVGLYLTVVLLAGATPLVFAVANANEFTAAAFLMGAAVISIVLLVLLHKGWSSIQDGYARLTPGKAVGRLFIPLYSLVWSWIAFVGYATDYNAFLKRHGSSARPQPKIWYAVFVIWHFVLPPVLALFESLPLFVVWLLIDFFAVAPVTCVILAKGINAVRQNAPIVPLAAVAKPG